MKKSSNQLLMLVVALGLSLSGCSDNKHADAAGQIAVKVNGQPIMAADFGIKPGLDGKEQMLQNVAESDMKVMVDLELLRQAAIEAKLDKKEDVRKRLADSTQDSARKTLAFAYVNTQLSSIAAPTEAEVEAFYSGNPAKFAERRQYELQVCAIKPNDGQADQIKVHLDKSKNFSDVEGWLKAKDIKHGCLPVTVVSDQAEEGIPQKLGNVPAGSSIVEDNNDQITVTFVQAMQDVPLALDQVKPEITKTLTDNRRSERYAEIVKQLREKATIEYVPPYSASGMVVKHLSIPEDKGH